MPGMRGSTAARVVAAAVLLACPAGVVSAADDDAFYPVVQALSDVTGDGVADVVVSQPVWGAPEDHDTLLVDGLSGRVLWRETVPSLLRIEVVALGGGARGLAVVGRTTGSGADANGRTLRLRVVDRHGERLWERLFEATNVVPGLYTTGTGSYYVGQAAGGALLVQNDVHVDGLAHRLTRTTVSALDPRTGATVADHGPIDTVDLLPEVRPLPGADAFAVVSAPANGGLGPGAVRAYDAADGTLRWETPVRTVVGAGLAATVAGRPPAPAVAVTTYPGGGGLQVLDVATGRLVVDRPRGDDAVVVGRGGGRRLRTTYVTPHEGERVGYGVQLLDLTGRVVAQRFFPLGDTTSVVTIEAGMHDAGDVDGDGWTDVVAHNAVSGGDDGPARDDRLISGRTLASATIPGNAFILARPGAGPAAVDGRGADLVLLRQRSATVVDGATRRPLIEVTAPRFLSEVIAVGPGCADVLVVTFSRGGIGLARLGPHGQTRWVSGPGSVRARDVSGGAGCARAVPVDTRAPRRGALPATGGVPAMGAAVVAAVAWGVGRAARRA